MCVKELERGYICKEVRQKGPLRGRKMDIFYKKGVKTLSISTEILYNIRW